MVKLRYNKLSLYTHLLKQFAVQLTWVVAMYDINPGAIDIWTSGKRFLIPKYITMAVQFVT